MKKFLTNFVDSDISDLEESEESEVINNLYDAFDNNNSFLLEELSREGPYEINIHDIKKKLILYVKTTKINKILIIKKHNILAFFFTIHEICIHMDTFQKTHLGKQFLKTEY